MDSFVCKIVIIRNDENRILKPKNTENCLMKTTRVNGIKRCLFGVSKIEDTEKMLQEQYDIDRKRFSERFGIDLRKIEDSERQMNSENINSSNDTQMKSNSVIGRKILKRNREVFRQQNNQTVLTDFYQARKTVQSLEKSSKNAKEN